MIGYTEVNYCIHIKEDEEKFYLFTKESIINNESKYVPNHKIVHDCWVYNVFFALYPILKEIPKENIQITKCWESWHPSKNTNK